MQQNLRTVKTGRVCFNTHSGHLLKEIATLQKHADYHLKPPSSMKTLSEKLILQNRLELQIVIGNILAFKKSSSWPHVDLIPYWNAVQFSTSIEDAVYAGMKSGDFV